MSLVRLQFSIDWRKKFMETISCFISEGRQRGFLSDYISKSYAGLSIVPQEEISLAGGATPTEGNQLIFRSRDLIL